MDVAAAIGTRRGVSPRPGFVTRFAPAPTGWLHLGHVANALYVWGLARRHGGRVLLRIEDHDRARCRAEYDAALLEDLDWLGFVPDGEVARQSARDAHYAEALARLDAAGLVYVCDCTRARVRAESAAPDGEEARYPGTCRSRALPPDASAMRRIRLPDGDERFTDLALGPQVQTPAAQCGDLLARDRAGNWTYQFAVVVDDLEQGVDVVIRGEDLFPSTGRQILLSRLLGRPEPPHFFHHPLIFRPDGTKLSKALGDTGVRELRHAGITAARVRGLAAAAAGLLAEPRDVAGPDDWAEMMPRQLK